MLAHAVALSTMHASHIRVHRDAHAHIMFVPCSDDEKKAKESLRLQLEHELVRDFNKSFRGYAPGPAYPPPDLPNISTR